MASYRRHGRTPLRCSVTLAHDAIGEWVAETRDVSATGIFVQCKALIGKIAVGDALVAKVCCGAKSVSATDVGLDRDYNAPAVDAPSLFTVVRLTEDGAALTSL